MGKGEERRNRIVEVAIDLLARKGATALTFEAVGQAAKIPRQHVKYYYPEKEDLLIACFERIGRQAQGITVAEIEKHHNWRDRLTAVFDGAFAWIESFPVHGTVLLLYYHYCALDPKLAAVQVHFRETGRARMEAMLAQADFKMKPALRTQLAFEFQIYLTGTIIEMISTNDLKNLPRFQKKARNFLKERLAWAANT